MRNAAVLIFAFLFLFSCSDTFTPATTSDNDEAGKVIELGTVYTLTLSEIETISRETLIALKEYLNIPDPEADVITPFDLKYSIVMIRVIYSTTNIDGDIVFASGALLAPQSSEQFPILGIQHGMVTHRNNVASHYVSTLGKDPGITPELLTGLLTASRGYITFLPDYLGFGVSLENPPFCHRKLTASTVVDMFRAVEPELSGLNIQSNGKRFLFGHSQGGYSSIAALDLFETEHDSLPITACAASAGPYSLSGMVEEILEQDTLTDNLYAPYLLFSTVNAGVGAIEEVFNESLADLVPSYFDGTRSTFDLRLTLPKRKTEMFDADFITAMKSKSGIGTKYLDEISSNDLLDISPSTKINLYYGENDIHIPGELNALKADSAWSANGTSPGVVTTIMLSGSDHITSVVPALMDAIDWFSAM